MSGVGVATEPDHYFEEHCFLDPDWPTDKLVTVCLLQWPDLVHLPDGLWRANANLIAEVRTALPELLRLARLGLSQDGTDAA